MLKRKDSSVTIFFDNIPCQGNKNNTILDTVLEAGVAIKYSCGVGQCKQCSFQLLSGKIHSNEDFQDRYLACQSYPLTDLNITQKGVKL
ncbi:hypothetical protein BHECKSOX_2490 [Bathymodiolus heckerae thiotrophic gill symbiont]|uniref:2Fe-2S iron-sulfur cluster-binding protein n=1 Tax=Bathymodiolus heckerae thiotrophic gill symbiont TaxID=1052212 RepID=UPI0010AF62EB|nr:2Fe-2S iron-sulfur cluster binding domain-containing protein [Bathymodiolus heckerae thiotrophic gill symbiont]SHN89886.1 hypothetical protein BHECKSOX_2490 [Bathymodiolus heckerae thiotrophic gill symbiont]